MLFLVLFPICSKALRLVSNPKRVHRSNGLFRSSIAQRSFCEIRGQIPYTAKPFSWLTAEGRLVIPRLQDLLLREVSGCRHFGTSGKAETRYTAEKIRLRDSNQRCLHSYTGVRAMVAGTSELKVLSTSASVICSKLHAFRAREYRRVLPVLTRETTPVESESHGSPTGQARRMRRLTLMLAVIFLGSGAPASWPNISLSCLTFCPTQAML